MFNIEKGLNDDIIYWSGNDASSPPITPTADDGDKDITAGTTIDNKVKPVQPNELVLPWKDQHWNLYITHPKSTVEVWARIIGAEYSVSTAHFEPYKQQSSDDLISFICFSFRPKWTP